MGKSKSMKGKGALIITGIDEIDKALKDFDNKMRKKVIRRAMRSSMKPLAAEIRDRFPKDSGDTAKDIKLRAGKRKKDTLQFEIRSKDDNFIPKFLEFGTSSEDGKQWIAPKPTFRPVFDEMGGYAKREFSRTIKDEVDKLNKKGKK